MAAWQRSACTKCTEPALHCTKWAILEIGLVLKRRIHIFEMEMRTRERLCGGQRKNSRLSRDHIVKGEPLRWALVDSDLVGACGGTSRLAAVLHRTGCWQRGRELWSRCAAAAALRKTEARCGCVPTWAPASTGSSETDASFFRDFAFENHASVTGR